MKNVIIVGSGFIASHLSYPIIKDRLEANDKQIITLLNLYKPDVVINCIGYCGIKNIDDCEINKDKTIKSNLIIPTLLATECEKLNIRMVQLSSGCVFYGESPNLSVSLDGPKDTGWKETDITNPLSFYSRTKYSADLILEKLKNVCSLRLRMPVSSKNNSRNLINKLLKYEYVLEHPNSMTFLPDLVRVIDWVIQNDKSGIYHIANPQPLTHSIILNEYKKYYPEHHFVSINDQELEKFISTPRSSCLLNTDKLNSEGFEMTNSFVALENCMKEFVANKRNS